MDAATPSPKRSAAPIKRVLTDSSLYLLGNVVGRVVAFLAIPFYSRFLSAGQYGLLELIELSTQTVALVFGLQAIGTALSRLFHDQSSPDAERGVVSTALIATAVLSGAGALGAMAGGAKLSLLLFHTEEWATLVQAAFAAMFFGNMVEVALVYERIRHNAWFFLWFSLVTMTVNLGLNILLIGFMGAGVWGFVSSKLIVSVGGCLFLGYRISRDVGWHWRPAFVPGLVRIGLPLTVSGLSYFAIHFSDRFFLASVVNLADLGRYALAYRFAILVSALVGDSFAKSWGVTLYRYTDQPDWRANFARVGSYFTYVLFLTGMGLALFSPELLRIMVPPSYMPPPLLLPVLISAYLVREIGDFFRSLMLINSRAVLVGKIAFAGALLNLALNALLIPRHGTYGAAYATLATWAIYMVVCWVVANREHRLPIHPGRYVRLGVLTMVVFAAAYHARMPSMVVQILLDGVWLALFSVAAALVFLTGPDRTAALRLGGSAVLWAVIRLRGKQAPCPPGPMRVLMLAYFYPPENEVGAARPQRLARFLRRGGVPVTVLTASPAAPGVPDEEDVCRIAAPGALPGVPNTVRAAGQVIGTLQRVFLPFDDRLGWLPAAFHTASRLVGPGTVLVSTHPPTVTHLAALLLQRRHGMTWVADFRDPLWGNPYRTSHRAGIIDSLVEQFTVESADAVIANTEASAAMLRARYPAMQDKVHVLWNGFDPEDGLVPRPRPAQERRVIAHVGRLYGDRTPLPFLLSLHRLIESGALDPATVQFRQVGRAAASCLNPAAPVIAALSALGCCDIRTADVPQAAARDCMLDAEWLLLLDINNVNPGLQVPAKLFEYVRTGRPVLALTVPGSSTEQVLEMSGVPHACVSLGLPPGEFDAAVLRFLRQPVAFRPPSELFRATFSAPRQAETLRRIIEAAQARRDRR